MGTTEKMLPALIAMMLATTALAGCANKFIPPDIDYDDAAPAVLSADPVGLVAGRRAARSHCRCPAS